MPFLHYLQTGRTFKTGFRWDIISAYVTKCSCLPIIRPEVLIFNVYLLCVTFASFNITKRWRYLNYNSFCMHVPEHARSYDFELQSNRLGLDLHIKAIFYSFCFNMLLQIKKFWKMLVQIQISNIWIPWMS